MIEIDKVDALYLCNRNDVCNKSASCNEDECAHTTCETFAKNASSVEIFNKFFDTFDVIVGDHENLIVWEKEKKNESTK